MKKESTWWAPHLLNEEQKYTHVRTARKLLKRFPRYDQKLFMNVVTCYDIKPVRKEEGKSYWKIPLCDDDATREK